MSLYTLKELNNKPAEIISSLILEGYKIIPTEQSSNKREFVAVLTKGNYTVKVITRCNYDYYVLIFTAKHCKSSKFDFEESRIYYKSYSDKYDERIKYISKCYEDMYLAGKAPEIYTKLIDDRWTI